MIAKVTHARSALLALRYDYGPGRSNEHVDPRWVAGNVDGESWRARARSIQAFVTEHLKPRRGPAPRSPLYRVALANPVTDRLLSDDEWGDIAGRFVQRFGAAGPWQATRHDEHHIHLTISRIGFNGERMSTSWDYARATGICRELEREHASTSWQRPTPPFPERVVSPTTASPCTVPAISPGRCLRPTCGAGCSRRLPPSRPASIRA